MPAAETASGSFDSSVHAVPGIGQSSDAPSLQDLSEKDKPWDKHRSNADRIQAHYWASAEFERYAQRVADCSQLLEFKLAAGSEGLMSLKLAGARFCRVRHCPVCQWRRSLRWKAKAHKVLPQVIEKYPKYRWVFLTLTIKNAPITELRDTLQHMNKSYQRMVQRKIWPAEGWLRSTEVTRGRDGTAHPHFHSLLLVKPSFFSHNYIRQDEWAELWGSCARLDYMPIVDARAVSRGKQPMQLIPELLKYCIKESDLVVDREWFLELTRQMYKLRCISTGGVLKEYLKALEQEPEDLIGESEDPDEVDEGSLYFGWWQKQKKYRLKDY